MRWKKKRENEKERKEMNRERKGEREKEEKRKKRGKVNRGRRTNFFSILCQNGAYLTCLQNEGNFGKHACCGCRNVIWSESRMFRLLFLTLLFLLLLGRK